MSGRYGTVTATLAEKAEQERLDEFAALINTRIKPIEPVSAADIFVRGMYVVSDEVNSFGGRFPVDEYPTLQEKLLNTPVMVGHRKDSLPIGRTFHAMQVERNGRMWVKSLFYWLKSTEDAQMLADNIDGGIYQECSIGFIYRLPECSVCGKDIRQCEHQVFSRYAQNNAEQNCHFVYREIEKVLETSLVYRGANPDTGMSRELAEGDGAALSDRAEAAQGNTGDDERMLVIPWYDSIAVKLINQNNALKIQRVDGGVLRRDMSKLLACSLSEKFSECYAQLVGYRGKERCSQLALERYVTNKPSPVTRLEIKLLPDKHGVMPTVTTAADDVSVPIRPIRYQIVTKEELAAISDTLRTKAGVRIWPLAAYDPMQSGKQFAPTKTMQKHTTLSSKALEQPACLILESKSNTPQYSLNQFNSRLWMAGRSFLADALTDKIENNTASQTQINANAALIRPVQLHGRKRFLVSLKQSKQVTI